MTSQGTHDTTLTNCTNRRRGIYTLNEHFQRGSKMTTFIYYELEKYSYNAAGAQVSVCCVTKFEDKLLVSCELLLLFGESHKFRNSLTG